MENVVKDTSPNQSILGSTSWIYACSTDFPFGKYKSLVLPSEVGQISKSKKIRISTITETHSSVFLTINITSRFRDFTASPALNPLNDHLKATTE